MCLKAKAFVLIQSCFFFLLFGPLETVDNVESFPPHFVHSFAFYMMIHFISQIKGDCRCARVSFWDGFSFAFAQLQLYSDRHNVYFSYFFPPPPISFRTEIIVCPNLDVAVFFLLSIKFHDVSSFFSFANQIQ